MVGVVPTLTGRQDGRLMARPDLQPRVARTGRYAMPVRPYVWRDPARFQKHGAGLWMEDPGADMPNDA